MLMAVTLSNSSETCDKMCAICSEWEAFSREKSDVLPRSKLQRCYLAAKAVCEQSFYLFRDVRLKGVFVDVVNDGDSHVLGFSISKVIKISHYRLKRPLHLLFLQYMTADPKRIEAPFKSGKVGEALINRLKERSNEMELDGIFSEPVHGIIPYFIKQHEFLHTEFVREREDGRSPRLGILWACPKK